VMEMTISNADKRDNFFITGLEFALKYVCACMFCLAYVAQLSVRLIIT